MRAGQQPAETALRRSWEAQIAGKERLTWTNLNS
uniref:Uncharacterized protein n=1 Tax=Podoviridae sp. ctiJY10 TaxID=2826572 RepID=A0A8S5N5D5_9CAUD|nr:MAG TPA: hypothetical protein [Podoviridae sp. ctiJY10]